MSISSILGRISLCRCVSLLSASVKSRYDFVTYDTAKNGFLAKQFFDTYSEVDAFGALWNETAVVDCSTLPYASVTEGRFRDLFVLR